MRGPALIAVALALMAMSGCAMLPQDPLDALAALEARPETEPIFKAAPMPPPKPELRGAESWLALGTRLLAQGDPARAEDAFVRSLRIEGMTAQGFTGAGIAAQRQGLLTKAKRHYERAKEIDSGYAPAHNNLGAALYALDRPHAARHAFRVALRLSGGGDETARRNLRMAELAIARAETDAPPGPPPEGGSKLQRVGLAAYKLITQTPARSG